MLDRLTPEQLDALGRMPKAIHDEYRNLGFTGLSVDPIRYLAFRQQTHNHLYTKLVVSDSGVFFLDPARKVKLKFDPAFFLVYQDGLHFVEEERIRASENPLIILENLLELWKRHGTGLVLVADHMNGCNYLLPEHKAELDRVQRLYSKEEFVINPMLPKKGKTSPAPRGGVLDLED
jgi:hypothetical protein